MPSNAVTTEVVTTNSYIQTVLPVRSNDFSRCLPVMAPAMTGIGSGGVDGGVTWQMPSNAVTTEVVTTNSYIQTVLPVRSNDFSRYLPVMALAMTGIGSDTADGGVTWRSAK
ncbi:hypothetical protein [Oscillatoria sp. HE19RPO]|uniref:hypothetical protein n=1 Tax=Oscillatoria sp. HE19RPO TaxID=2954806 RepID=UPI0020C24A90|nr:hypothetical protein [Oscillatoria sp. HE19RPO]